MESPTLASTRSSRHSLSPPFSPPMSSILCEGSISSASSTPSRSDKVEIPEHWREETQDCIEGVMDDSSRSDIVRTLVTLLVARHGPRPGRYRCEEVARRLILKYPFMKDDLGSGYVSVKFQMVMPPLGKLIDSPYQVLTLIPHNWVIGKIDTPLWACTISILTST